MKILMTADPIGGVWTYAMDLCAALAANHCDVVLATLGAPLSHAQRAQAAGLRNMELRESTFLLEWMNSPWQSLESAAHWLMELEAEVAPDVIHLNHLVHGDLPWRAPVIVVGHSCVLSWWTAVRNEPAPESLATYRTRVRNSLRAANLVLAPTRAMMAALTKLYGPFKASRVIPNGRDGAGFGMGRKEPLILSAGRLWDDGKNVRLLCEIADRLPWPVHIAGSDTSPDGQRQSLSGVNAPGHLTSERLARWYRRAAIYALPARYEPFGLTALEAALCGCALVLGNLESLREVWGTNALYVCPDDPEELLTTLLSLIRDPSRRARYATLALLHATQYTPEKTASRYLGAYASVLKQKEIRACVSHSSITL